MIEHLKTHTVHSCPECRTRMQLTDQTLPFGSSLMVTWLCPSCQSEDLVVVQDDGQWLRVEDGSSNEK